MAEAQSQHTIDVVPRDVDVPLSALGEEQARALGTWVGALPLAQQPTVVLCSPYLRARETARIMMEGAGLRASDRDVALRFDERLREKEFGVLDRLTRHGIRAKYPELDEQKRHVGKFYFRPPGGESWCDVILRLRGVLDTMVREYRRERVVVVAHQVIVNCFRYLLDRLDESEILEIDRQADVPNCGVTSYVFDPQRGKHGKLVLERANFVAPGADVPVTTAPDPQIAPKS